MPTFWEALSLKMVAATGILNDALVTALSTVAVSTATILAESSWNLSLAASGAAAAELKVWRPPASELPRI
jgi:hypothetical protein